MGRKEEEQKKGRRKRESQERGGRKELGVVVNPLPTTHIAMLQ